MMRNLTRSRIGLCSLTFVAAFTVAPAVALAQGGGVKGQIGSLPVTGMDLLIVTAVAFVITGTSFAARRLSRPRRARESDLPS